MKRVNNLFDQIVSIENLNSADIKARIGKNRSYGVNKHDKKKVENILNLHNLLKSGTFKTSKYHVFSIKTSNGKDREIYQLPYYPDRIVHHAIMNVMEPVWTNIFTKDTHSCIKGRGIHGAFRSIKNSMVDIDNTKYCLKLDVKKFYPTINHSILKSIIRKKIKDTRVLSMLDEIIDSAPGVPIGNYLSQFFANLYLAYFDHWIKEVLKVKHYCRYADDIVILSGNKAELHQYLIQIKDYLIDVLKLTIKENYQIFPVEKRGIDFVGYVFYHDRILLRKSIKQSFARKVSKLKKRKYPGEHLKKQICSYLGWVKHCNAINLTNKLLNESTV